MPITQQRLDLLLREHEDVLTRARNAASALQQVISLPETATDWPSRKVLLETYLADLRALPDKWAVVERERLKRNWKRNERMAEKLKRRRRNAGITPHPERGDIAQSDLQTDATFDAEYEAFNRGELK